MQLQGRVALVTGAGSGIGRAAALLLAQEGARLALLDMDEDALSEVAATIHAAGGAASTHRVNVAEAAQVAQAVDAAAARWGGLDCLFVNAGINGTWAPLDELEPAAWRETLAVNLDGTFYTVKYALPHLRAQGRGSIVITASVNGTRMFSNTGATAYASSKAAQVAFAKMIALELAKHRIRVNVICPGWIESNIEAHTHKQHLEAVQEPVEFPEGAVPLTDGGPGCPEQVAQLVLFLLSDAASHISGSEVWIDGAQSLLQG